MKQFIAILIAGLCTSCHNYFKEFTVDPTHGNKAMQTLDSLKFEKRYFIFATPNHSTS